MFENSASIGMGAPVFGQIPLRKYQTGTFEAPVPSYSQNTTDLLSPKITTHDASTKAHLTGTNPLITNVFLPEQQSRNVLTNVDYKRDLIIAQRELKSAHEEILKLEAELKAARYK